MAATDKSARGGATRGRESATEALLRIAFTSTARAKHGREGAPVDLALHGAAADLVMEFAAKLHDRIDHDGEHSLDGIDASEVAERLVGSLPSSRKSEWDALIGPFYDTAALAAWKGITRQRLSVLRQQHRLLGLRTADGEIVHPSFQFDERGGLLPGFRVVDELLAKEIPDEWTRALWFNTAIEEWGGRTAAQMLRGSADDLAAVQQMAEQDLAGRRTMGPRDNDAEARQSRRENAREARPRRPAATGDRSGAR